MLILTACSSNVDVQTILQSNNPTYMNVDKINESSYLFLNKENLYILSNNEGLSNSDMLTVDNKDVVFTTKITSTKTDKQATALIGLKQGNTPAHITHSDGAVTNFTLQVQ